MSYNLVWRQHCFPQHRLEKNIPRVSSVVYWPRPDEHMTTSGHRAFGTASARPGRLWILKVIQESFTGSAWGLLNKIVPQVALTVLAYSLRKPRPAETIKNTILLIRTIEKNGKPVSKFIALSCSLQFLLRGRLRHFQSVSSHLV